MEGFLVFLLVVVILGVVIWLLSWLAGGLLAVLGGLLAWLAALWPGWPGWAACFAIATVFAAHRLLLLPFRISHFRVDRLALQLTDDHRPDQRRQAAEKLTTIGPWALPARPSLEKALQDENETVRDAARKALARVK